MQLDLDFTNKGYRRWAIDRCNRLKTLVVVEGGRPIKLNASEAKVLLYKIAEYDDCYASVGRLSDETGISKRNIERLLKAMQKEGLLAITPRPSERGHFPTNRYVIFYSELPDEAFFCAPPSAIPSATPTATPSAMVADNIEIKKKEREYSSSKSKKPRNSTGTTYRPASTEATEGEESFSSLDDLSFEEVVCLFAPHMGVAERLVTSALQRGCSLRSLKALVVWFDRFMKLDPNRWDRPGTVLMIRLQNARVGLRAWQGWIPGKSCSKKEIPF